MRIQDIKIGEWYRLQNTSGEFCKYYGWVKVLEIYKKNDYNNPLRNKKSVVKRKHVINKRNTAGFIRYFNPKELVGTKGE